MNKNPGFKTEVATPGERDVVVRRRFRAPASLVWRSYTEPPLVKRWLLGPPGWSMPVCEIDLRVGGTYRYRWRSEKDGTEFGFVGTFETIDPERRIVNKEWPEDVVMPEARIVVDFVPLGDMTELVMTISYEDTQTRKAALDTGMTDGMGMSFNNLDAVLEDLRAT
jgi:uncharacterized protein YndB with AHSA1/START domain